MKKLFSISGKFEQNGKWSNLEKDFVGYFSLDPQKDTFIGYMEEQYNSIYDKERFIVGILLKKNNISQMVFLKMSNEPALAPIFYAFLNIEKDGDWFAWDPNIGLRPQGKGKVAIKEIDYTQELEDKISTTYNKVIERNLKNNSYLLEKVNDLSSFLE